jgi:hypothetical protein
MPLIASSCPWCHALVYTVESTWPFCPCCGHQADVPRLACTCPACSPHPPAEAPGVPQEAPAARGGPSGPPAQAKRPERSCATPPGGEEASPSPRTHTPKEIHMTLAALPARTRRAGCGTCAGCTVNRGRLRSLDVTFKGPLGGPWDFTCLDTLISGPTVPSSR